MTAALAPAMMAKAEGIAAAVMREMRQEICVLRINEDLDICGPNQKEAFSITITPALIATIGLLPLVMYAIMMAGRMTATKSTGNTDVDTALDMVSPIWALWRRA